MARPSTPMAAPGAPSAPKPGGGAAKTMFGMPAMKLPTHPGAAPASPTPVPAAPPPTVTQPAAAVAPAPTPASPSAPDDAFKATILGIPAVVDGGEAALRNTAPASDVPTPDAVPNTVSPSVEKLEDAGFSAATAALPAMNEATLSPQGQVDTGAPVPAKSGGNKMLMWILIGVGGFLTLVGIAIFVYFFVIAPAMQVLPVVPQGLQQAVPQNVPTAVPQAPAMPTLPTAPGAAATPTPQQ